MKKSLKKISILELAAIVSRKLEEYEFKIVLTGGACVSIYTKNKYKSLDLDFVPESDRDLKNIKTAMSELGFVRKPEGYFENENCPYMVEFVAPPLSVGSEPVWKIEILKNKLGNIRILSATDCVKDRLAAYYHWNDRQSLEQAVLVAKAQKVNFKEIKRWSIVEDKLEKYKQFEKSCAT